MGADAEDSVCKYLIHTLTYGAFGIHSRFGILRDQLFEFKPNKIFIKFYKLLWHLECKLTQWKFFIVVVYFEKKSALKNIY